MQNCVLTCINKTEAFDIFNCKNTILKYITFEKVDILKYLMWGLFLCKKQFQYGYVILKSV